jgi:hypothetical protein
MSDVRKIIDAHMASAPRMSTLSATERELVSSALEGAATVVAAMVSRVVALCDDSETGMVSVEAVKEALADGQRVRDVASRKAAT